MCGIIRATALNEMRKEQLLPEEASAPAAPGGVAHAELGGPAKRELLQTILWATRIIPLVIPFNVIVLVLLLDSAWPVEIVAAWLLAVIAGQIEYLYFHRRFTKLEPHDNANIDRWINACMVRYGLNALMWACLLPIFWLPGAIAQNSLLFSLLAMYVCITTLTTYPIIRIHLATTVPVLLMGFAGAILDGDKFILILQLFAFIGYAYLTKTSAILRHTLRDSITLRLSNSRLFHDLAEEKIASDRARRNAEQVAARLQQREAYSRALIENAFDAIIVTDNNGIMTYASPAARQLGHEPDDFIGNHVLHFLLPERAKKIGKNIFKGVQGSDALGRFIEPLVAKSGAIFWIEILVTDLRTDPNINGFILNVRNITERKRTDDELQSHFRVLESLARGAPLTAILETLAKGVEKSNPGAHAAILLISEGDTTIEIATAPSIDPDFGKIMGRLDFSSVPSGIALAERRQVAVPNIFKHNEFSHLWDICRRFNITAIWAQPIISRSGHALGTLAMFFDREHAPTDWEEAFLTGAAHIAGIAIDRRREEANLRSATETAEMANRAKSKFLATMSHELRTPLNAIIGFSEIMMKNLFGPLGCPNYEGYAHDIYDSGNHLLNVIDDILDISKIEAGRYKLEYTEVDIIDTIKWSVEMVRPRTTEKNQIVTVTTDENIPHIHADQRAMRQIMLNLLSNAAKFTPDRGRIDVFVRLTDENKIEVSVHDTGIGIPTDKLIEVMLPFGQVDDETARKYPGTGLGLPITKSLVEMHQGTFTLESELGSGTIVSFILPADKDSQSQTLQPAPAPQ